MNEPTTDASAPVNYYLKCEQPHFDEVWAFRKPFELRLDDRGIEIGDKLILLEYSKSSSPEYSGRQIEAVVTHILRGFNGLAPGWACFSIRVLFLRAPTVVWSHSF